MSQIDLVSVTLVTYNSGRFIKKCLESVLAQKYPDLELIVIDNASTDGTTDILEPFEDRCRIVYNQENVGFAAAQNQAIAMSRGEWILTLNPDVLLLPGFIQQLVEAGTDAVHAAEAKNPERLFTTGGDIYEACSNCHQKYMEAIVNANR